MYPRFQGRSYRNSGIVRQIGNWGHGIDGAVAPSRTTDVCSAVHASLRGNILVTRLPRLQCTTHCTHSTLSGWDPLLKEPLQEPEGNTRDITGKIQFSGSGGKLDTCLMDTWNTQS